MTAESMLWLLLTGQVPTPEQSRELSLELAEKGDLPPFIEKLIDSWAFFLEFSREFHSFSRADCLPPSIP